MSTTWAPTSPGRPPWASSTRASRTTTRISPAGCAAQNFALGYPSTLIADRDGHGSHVAGIAAGRGNNGIGVSGVAYGKNIKLISAKACELYLFPGNVVGTSCPNSSTANAIVWGADNGANVINLSLGGSPAATTGSAAHQAALQYARAKNVLPLCATGNDNYRASPSRRGSRVRCRRRDQLERHARGVLQLRSAGRPVGSGRR
jgi:subtilisin family serine protease